MPLEIFDPIVLSVVERFTEYMEWEVSFYVFEGTAEAFAVYGVALLTNGGLWFVVGVVAFFMVRLLSGIRQLAHTA